MICTHKYISMIHKDCQHHEQELYVRLVFQLIAFYIGIITYHRNELYSY